MPLGMTQRATPSEAATRVPRAAARDRVVRAAVVVDLDEFVVRSAGTANAELADDQLRVGGRNGQEQAQADQPETEHRADDVFPGAGSNFFIQLFSFVPLSGTLCILVTARASGA